MTNSFYVFFLRQIAGDDELVGRARSLTVLLRWQIVPRAAHNSGTTFDGRTSSLLFNSPHSVALYFRWPPKFSGWSSGRMMSISKLIRAIDTGMRLSAPNSFLIARICRILMLLILSTLPKNCLDLQRLRLFWVTFRMTFPECSEQLSGVAGRSFSRRFPTF